MYDRNGSNAERNRMVVGCTPTEHIFSKFGAEQDPV